MRAHASSLALLLVACSEPARPRIDVCGRGDRDVLIDTVDSLELRFLDEGGASLGDAIDLPLAGDQHIADDIPERAATVEVFGFHDDGVIAAGRAAVDPDGACVCLALVEQEAAACGGLACRVESDECRFYDADGAPVASRTIRLGENAGDDLAGVTIDTFLDPNEATVSHGTEDLIKVDVDLDRVGLLRFDLSGIPRAADLARAELQLTVCESEGCESSASFDAHFVLEPWDEEATWDEREPGEPWMTPGCGPGSRAADPFARLERPEVLGMTYALDASSAVRAWLDDPSANLGVVIVSDPTGSGLDVYSSEAPDVVVRPRLEIEFTLP